MNQPKQPSGPTTDTNSQHASMKRSLSVAAIIMTGSVLLSRVMGLIRVQVLASQVGAGTEMDAYVTAFLLPELVNHFLAGGFLSVTFIPIYQRYIASNDQEKANDVFSNLLTIGTVIVAALIVVCMVFTDDILLFTERLKTSFGMSEGAQRSRQWVDQTVRLTRIVLPAQLFFYWGSFFMAVQYAHKKFFLPALMPLCYNLGIILGGVFLYPFLGIEGFSWGVLVGAFAGGVIVQVPGALRLGARYRFTWKPRDPDLRKYVFLSLPFILGLSVTFSNEFLFRFFGLFLSEGALSYLNYAFRITMLLVGVFGMAFSAASFPFLSQLASEGKTGELARLSNAMVAKTSAVIMPASAIMLVLAAPVIAVLFQRGEFEPSSTLATAPVLKMYLLGAPAFAFSMVLMRSFYAVQNTLVPMIISSLTVVAALPLYWFLGKMFGPGGIGLSSSLAMFCQFVILYTIWNRRIGAKAEVWDLMQTLLKTLLISIAGGLACYGLVLIWRQFTIHTGIVLIDNALLLAFAGGPSLVLSAVLLQVFRIQNIRDAVSALRRR